MWHLLLLFGVLTHDRDAGLRVTAGQRPFSAKKMPMRGEPAQG
jgi:hypothetical protein